MDISRHPSKSTLPIDASLTLLCNWRFEEVEGVNLKCEVPDSFWMSLSKLYPTIIHSFSDPWTLLSMQLFVYSTLQTMTDSLPSSKSTDSPQVLLCPALNQHNRILTHWTSIEIQRLSLPNYWPFGRRHCVVSTQWFRQHVNIYKPQDFLQFGRICLGFHNVDLFYNPFRHDSSHYRPGQMHPMRGVEDVNCMQQLWIHVFHL